MGIIGEEEPEKHLQDKYDTIETKLGPIQWKCKQITDTGLYKPQKQRLREQGRLNRLDPDDIKPIYRNLDPDSKHKSIPMQINGVEDAYLNKTKPKNCSSSLQRLKI